MLGTIKAVQVAGSRVGELNPERSEPLQTTYYSSRHTLLPLIPITILYYYQKQQHFLDPSGSIEGDSVFMPRRSIDGACVQMQRGLVNGAPCVLCQEDR